MPHVWLGSDVRQAYPCLSAGWLPRPSGPCGAAIGHPLPRIARTNGSHESPGWGKPQVPSQGAAPLRRPMVQASFLKVRTRIGLLPYVEFSTTTIEHHFTNVKWRFRNLHDGARGTARSGPIQRGRNARMPGGYLILVVRREGSADGR